jgi:hypothetical protein
VAVQGTGEDVKRARDILVTVGAGEVTIYSNSQVEEPVTAKA